jgi:hypothetical protein
VFYFPSGIYVTDSLIVGGGVILKGEAKNNTALVLKPGATGNLITFLNARNSGIENFTINANMLGGRNGKSSGIVIKQDPGKTVQGY